MGELSAEEVRAALNDADYPATKESLVEAAGRAGAGEGVDKALRSLPVAEYGNLDEVIRSLDTTEARGQRDADKAVRARESTRRGLAEHMSDRQSPRLEPD